MATSRPQKKQAEQPKEPEQKKKVGRPTVFSPRLADDVVTSVRLGNYIETAAGAAGISKDTLYNWLRDGARQKREGAEPEYVDLNLGKTANGDDIIHAAPANLPAFSDAVLRAEYDAEQHDIAVIGAAGQTDWRAVAWRRERKDPTKWGRRERIVLTQETRAEIAAELVEILKAVLQEHVGDGELRKAILLAVIERGTVEE